MGKKKEENIIIRLTTARNRFLSTIDSISVDNMHPNGCISLNDIRDAFAENFDEIIGDEY